MAQNSFTKLISNEQHYSEVLSRVASVKHTLWIGTADIKNVYVKDENQTIPLLAILDRLVRRGVLIRLIPSHS